MRRPNIAESVAFRLCSDPELRARYSSAIDLFTGESLDDPEEAADEIRRTVEESVKRTVDRVADIQFFKMQKSGQWGRHGRETVEFSYCRLKSNVSPDDDVDQEHLRQFERWIDKHRLYQRSLEELDKYERWARFKLFGRTIPVRNTDAVNEELRFCGSKNRVVTGMQGLLRSMIYGEADCSRIDGYDVYRFHREIARTPVEIVSMAGTISTRDIVVRQESCRAIITLKWMVAAESADIAPPYLCDDVAENVRETIKVRALAAYDALSPEKLTSKRELVIDEIADGVLWHETGHALHYGRLSTEQSAIAKAFNFFGDTIGDVLLEALADWASGPGAQQGPIRHFVSLADHDPEKARRMLLAYMSDNWFIDTRSQPGGGQTEILVALLCPFIVGPAKFDFPALAARLDDVYQLLFQASLDIGERVAGITRKASYDVNGTAYGYDFIAENIDIVVRSGNPGMEPGAVEYRTAIWYNSFMMLKKRSPSALAEARKAIEDADAAFRIKMLNVLAPEEAAKYGTRTRDYLFDQMKAKGFFTR